MTETPSSDAVSQADYPPDLNASANDCGGEAGSISPAQDPAPPAHEKEKERKRLRDIDYEERKRQKRLEANRRSAAASRQRRLDLIANLQQTVAHMSVTIANLEMENADLRRHVDYRRMSQAHMMMPQQGSGPPPHVHHPQHGPPPLQHGPHVTQPPSAQHHVMQGAQMGRDQDK